MNYYFFQNLQLPLLDQVYEPREDSYLLAQHVKVGKNMHVLDVGCGSGIQTVNALLQGALHVTAIDVNEIALKNTELSAQQIGKKENIILTKSNLFEKIPKGKKFDVIVFNPPYVVSHSLALPEIDGGKKGREVLDKFLDGVKNYLNENGTCYFLQSHLNGAKETERKLKKLGFVFEIIGKEKVWFEELQVWKAKFEK